MEYMKLKLRKIGNSLGVIIPKNVITLNSKDGFIDLNVITFSASFETKTTNVITKVDKNVITLPKVKENVITFSASSEPNVITSERKSFNFETCNKHHGSYKGSCGCN